MSSRPLSMNPNLANQAWEEHRDFVIANTPAPVAFPTENGLITPMESISNPVTADGRGGLYWNRWTAASNLGAGTRNPDESLKSRRLFEDQLARNFYNDITSELQDLQGDSLSSMKKIYEQLDL